MKKLSVMLTAMLILMSASFSFAGGLAERDGGHYVLYYPDGYQNEIGNDGVEYLSPAMSDDPSLAFFFEGVEELPGGASLELCQATIKEFVKGMDNMLSQAGASYDQTRPVSFFDRDGFSGCGVSYHFEAQGQGMDVDQNFYYRKGGDTFYSISGTYMTNDPDAQAMRESVDGFLIK